MSSSKAEIKTYYIMVSLEKELCDRIQELLPSEPSIQLSVSMLIKEGMKALENKNREDSE